MSLLIKFAIDSFTSDYIQDFSANFPILIRKTRRGYGTRQNRYFSASRSQCLYNGADSPPRTATTNRPATGMRPVKRTTVTTAYAAAELFFATSADCGEGTAKTAIQGNVYGKNCSLRFLPDRKGKKHGTRLTKRTSAKL